MFIIYGSKLYGRVDEVPGFFHVETKFGHGYYFPLFPVASYLVVSKDGEGWRGRKIPMSLKSVLLAWLRAGAIAVAIVSGIEAIVHARRPDGNWSSPAITCGAAVATFVLLKFPRWTRRAGYRRARRLGEYAGLSPEGFRLLDELYGASETFPIGTADP